MKKGYRIISSILVFVICITFGPFANYTVNAEEISASSVLNVVSAIALTQPTRPTSFPISIPQRPQVGATGIIAGGGHSVALNTNGTVVAVGDNYYGQCNTTAANGFTDIVAISAGNNFTVGLKSNGTVVAVGDKYSSGCNATAVNGFTDIVAISAKYDVTVGLKSDGTVVAVGDNSYGQCNTTAANGFTDIVAVAVGYQYTLGLKRNGTVVAVGNKYAYGYNTTAANGFTDIVAISASYQVSIGLKRDGTVVAVGDNSYGQCNTTAANGFTDIVAISSGSRLTAGLKSDGTVVTVGDDFVNKYQATAANGFTDIVAISATYPDIIGLRSDGTVVAVGDNYYGECNTVANGFKDIVAFEVGSDTIVGLKRDGTVVAFGNNEYGQCNISKSFTDIVDITNSYKFTYGLKKDGTVVYVGDYYSGYDLLTAGFTDIAAIEASEYNNNLFGLKSNGTVVATGNNYDGQCNTTEENGFTDIVAISAGYRHIVGLKRDGTVVALGNNAYGQCNTTASNGFTDIVAISAGERHTLGLKRDGTVVAVGDNSYGQCNTTASNGFTDIKAISAGAYHSLGLKSDGTVVAIGDNTYRVCETMAANGFTNIVSISASGGQTVGMTSDGKLVCTTRSYNSLDNVIVKTDTATDKITVSGVPTSICIRKGLNSILNGTVNCTGGIIESVSIRVSGWNGGLDGNGKYKVAYPNTDFYRLTNFDIDTNSEPFNLTGAYTVEIWAKAVGDQGEKLLGTTIVTVTGPTINGQFFYSNGDKNYQTDFHYDDLDFSDSSYNFNQDLAEMSMCLTMSAFETAGGDYGKNKSNNVRDLLTKIGFEPQSIETPGYEYQPDTDSIAAAIAKKKLLLADGSTCTLLAIAIRGAGYEREWSSNFKVGDGDFHQGFKEARDKILTYLNTFIKNNKDDMNDKVKIWITGFSRAAATANLVAGALDNGYLSNSSGILLAPEDVYAYCFETPAGVKENISSDSKYNNIFNIVNPNDPVPKVAPADWGYSRYGTTLYLPTPETTKDYKDLKDKMLDRYAQLSGFTREDYIVDNFAMKNVSVASFLLGWKNSDLNLMLNSFKDDTTNYRSQNAFLDRMISIIAEEEFINNTNYIEKYQNNMMKFGEALGNTKWVDMGPITAYNLLQLLHKIVDSHPDYSATLIANFKGIGSAHFPELCLAWMRSFDGPSLPYTDGRYKIFSINCPVDIGVFDSNNNLVASIIDDVPQEVHGSSIISSIDEDGQKVIYLPAQEEFIIKVHATDNGKMSYSVSEFNPNKGDITHVVNYYDVKISKGDTLTGVQKLDNANETTEKLIGTDGNEIPVSEDLGGDSIEKYMVNVQPQGNGTVLGEGIRIRGEYAKLTASPNGNSEFLGWYINDEKVSSGLEYRFCVLSDISVVAKFTSNTEITIGDYIKSPTNKDITVTATTNEGILNETSHTFTENGSFEFVVTDVDGNILSTKTVTIANIDKIPPVITLGEYTTEPTNQDVTVTAITNEGTLNVTTYIFTENSSFDFVVTDEAGNTTVKTVTITNIDKIAPEIVTNLNDGTEFERFGTFELSSSATDNPSGIESLETYLDGTLISNQYTFSFDALTFGTHKIEIKARDKAGNVSQNYMTIRITATKSTIEKLITRFSENGAIDNKGVYISLMTKLKQKTLTSFINEVKAQKGKHIKDSEASLLIEYANWVNSK